MKRRPIMVSVIVVLRNDQDRVIPYVEEALELLSRFVDDHELILIDDSSTDATVDRVHQLLEAHAGLRLIRLTRTLGFDIAASAGLDSALGDFVVVMDPIHDPIQRIPDFLSLAEAGPRVVVGLSNRSRPHSKTATFGAVAFRWLCRWLFGLSIDDYTSTFYVFPRAAVQSISRENVKVRYLPSLAFSVGFQKTIAPYVERSAIKNRPKLRFSEQVDRVAAYVLASNANPLRLVTYLGLAGSGLNLAYAFYVVCVNVIKKTAEGWTTLSLQVSGLFFLVFLILVLISEYLRHILEESRDRPLYHVLAEVSSGAPSASIERRNVVERSTAEPASGGVRGDH